MSAQAMKGLWYASTGRPAAASLIAAKYPARSAQRGGHQVSTASAPAVTAARVSASAWRSEGAPVPAITGTGSGTAARTASISAVRSAPVRVPASPVVPLTSTAARPRAARPAASLPVETASTSPPASNRVTSATPTPRNRGPGSGAAGVPGSGAAMLAAAIVRLIPGRTAGASRLRAHPATGEGWPGAAGYDRAAGRSGARSTVGATADSTGEG